MAKTTKGRTFSISARIVLDTGIDVSAESLEAALTQARQLKVSDFIDINGMHNDSHLQLVGVYDSSTPLASES